MGKNIFERIVGYKEELMIKDFKRFVIRKRKLKRIFLNYRDCIVLRKGRKHQRLGWNIG